MCSEPAPSHFFFRRFPAVLVTVFLIVACEAGPDPGTSATDTGETANPPVPVDTGLVRSGRAGLFYRAVGSGPPVVVLHGGPGLEHGYLRPGLEPLARENRLVFYDQRGSGRSPAPLDSASITLDNFLADLDVLQDSLGYDRMSLLGHSWGGLLALLYASSRPDRVRSLILMSSIEPGTRYAGETAERQGSRQRPEDSAAIQELVRSQAFQDRNPEAVRRLYRLSFRATFADPRQVDDLALEVNERTARAAGRLPALLLGPVSPYDYWDRLSTVEAPTLVLHGTEDPIPPTMAREMSRMIPDAELVLLDGVGHFPFVEAPDTLYGAVRRFLAEHGR